MQLKRIPGAGGNPAATRPARFIAYAWGDRYVDELLTITLPAALAPGNLPYVASLVPCEVVLLTEERLRSHVDCHPTIQRIRRLCPVRLLGLDDLLTSKDKYGMTLTHALHRGFCDLGSAATETYLLFLNADFVVAEGSFRSVLRSLMSGERLVAAPSYCVASREIMPELRSRIEATTGALCVAHRELAKLALHNLHNTVLGKTLNQTQFHLTQMDQFYWRLDENTLLGHQMPVAIVGMRPERFIAEPNSYWDHGLIGEFCPNAQPHILGDSDDFLMIELREKEVAQDQITFGPVDPRDAGERMIGWVTPYQRSFAKYQLTLHANDLPPSIAAGRARLDAYVDEILSHCPRVLPSHLDHPQWNYHLAPFMAARHQHLSSRLGRVTETEQPPADLSQADRVWWQLDGAKKRWERIKADLEGARDAQMDILRQQVNEVSRTVEAQGKEINERFMVEFEAAAEMEMPASEGANAKPRFFFDSGLDGQSNDLSGGQGDVLKKYRAEFALFKKKFDEKIAQLNKALHSIYLDYERELGLVSKSADRECSALAEQYAGAARKRVTSALVPQVRFGDYANASAGKNPTSRFSKLIANVSRRAQLILYSRPLGHIRGIGAAAIASGARNILVVNEGAHGLDLVPAHLSGLRASVTTAGLRSGNLGSSLDPAARFDICVCELDAEELLAFSDIVSAVKFCMKPGGVILGFHWNKRRAVLPMESIRLPSDVAVRTFVEKLPTYVTIITRAQAALAAHGLLTVTQVVLSKLAQKARPAARRQGGSPQLPQSLVAGKGVAAIGTAITIEVRLPSALATDVLERQADAAPLGRARGVKADKIHQMQ